MDYRELLLKYIAHVGECEGSTFIHDIYRKSATWISGEEWAVLERLNEESRKHDVIRDD